MKTTTTTTKDEKKTNAELVQVAKVEVDIALQRAKECLAEAPEEYENAKERLKDKLFVLNKALNRLAYEEFNKTERPLITAITTQMITRYKITEEKDDDVITDIDILPFDDRVDLKDFCTKYKIDKKFLTTAFQLHELYKLRTNYKLVPKDYLMKTASPFFERIYTKKELGETPDSRRKMDEKTKAIVNEVIAAQNVDNTDQHISVRSEDFAFLNNAVTKWNKKGRGVITVVSESAWKMIILDFLHRVFTNGTYTVEIAGNSTANDTILEDPTAAHEPEETQTAHEPEETQTAAESEAPNAEA